MTFEKVRRKNSNRFTCGICLEAYNQTNRRPHILVPCGHTFCLSCINALKVQNCPNDSTAIREKIPNWEIIGQILNNGEDDDDSDNVFPEDRYASQGSPTHEKPRVQPSAPTQTATRDQYPSTMNMNFAATTSQPSIKTPPNVVYQPNTNSTASQSMFSRFRRHFGELSTERRVFSILVPFGFLPICLIYPFAIAILGGIYTNQCPIDPRIPTWLKAYGSTLIFLFVFATVTITFAILNGKKRPPNRVILLLSFFVFIPLLFLALFVIIWFFVGNVWVFSIYTKVKFDDESSTAFCHRTLFYFTFWTLLIPYILLVLTIVIAVAIACCCRCICVKEC